MPTIGWFEILIVAAVAIVVIGPKDFPFMLKKAGSWIGTIKKYINNLQNEVNDLDLNSINTEEPKIKIKNKDKDNDKI
ncbi:Sec-independent protein translocase protein TatB [Candidatus Pelagibacter sp. Uisw_099_02]|uniref:Sec-independent protein translocase protein TatB n=1 Tax=Candidatus Pelagibacter sp. Uisw_099_02 TaxID=3230981 RepID=UPI0039EC4F06|tara:strand:+ start:146 stop:379 length:234 start_codon:yes stop_codon:yes gene_type:complete